jgi:hypothetical protein
MFHGQAVQITMAYGSKQSIPHHTVEKLWIPRFLFKKGSSLAKRTPSRKTKPPGLSVSGAGGCLYFYLVLSLRVYV